MRMGTAEKLLLGLSAFAAIAVTVLVLLTAYQHATAAEPEPPEVTDWKPPIRNCPDDIELWDCIRHAKYREVQSD